MEVSLYYTKRHPPEVFYKKGVLRNLATFIGKDLCPSLFFNKVAELRPATLLKKRLWYSCFSVNFAKFLKTAFYRTRPVDCVCTLVYCIASKIMPIIYIIQI